MRARFVWLLFAVLAAIAASQEVGAQPGEEPVSITLLAEAQVAADVVQIGQVARLDGGSPRLREALAKLDIAEWAKKEERLVVSREQVRYRLLLQGLSPRAFRLAGGPEKCLVRRSHGLSEDAIQRAASKALAEKHPGPAPKLARPIVLPVLHLNDDDHIALDGKVVGRTPLGDRTRVEVDVLVNGLRRAVVLTEFEPAGPTAPGLLKLTAHETAAKDAASEERILVKSRDRVKMVAMVGATWIVAAGEALQDGRRGETIRVRNVDSNKVINGRVAAAGLVEVEY